MDDAANFTLDELASQFLGTLTVKKRQKTEPAVAKFVRWCGKDRPATNVTGREVERYAQELSIAAATESSPCVRAFLNYAHKQGTFRLSLAPSFRIRKSTTSPARKRAQAARTVSQLTREGIENIESEIKELKSQRPALAEAINRAAADKDFRENAPLEAAREAQGRVESRIIELEQILRTAEVIREEEARSDSRVAIGRTVALENLTNGKKVHYKLVSPSEAKLSEGKISVASPVGKAMLGRSGGDEVVVQAPAGAMRFRIIQIVS